MKTLRSAVQGRVVCDQLYPVTEVQIGLYKQEFTFHESGCHIRIYGESLVTH